MSDTKSVLIPVRLDPSIAGKAPVSLDAISNAELFITEVLPTLKPPSALNSPGVKTPLLNSEP